MVARWGTSTTLKINLNPYCNIIKLMLQYILQFIFYCLSNFILYVRYKQYYLLYIVTFTIFDKYRLKVFFDLRNT